MKGLFIQKKIILLIIVIFIFSSTASASQLYNEKNPCFIYLKINEFEENLLVISGNSPPETPDINGPTIGKPGIELEYTIVSTDPESNDIVYCYDWGDDTGQVCIGPYPSGEEVIISHTWTENGTYTITVKASDIFGEESGIASIKVKISTSRNIVRNRNMILELIRFFNIMKGKL
ncbi:MAG: hypothetical protein AYK22_02555 [Thermoplasmatales archaeon SG8-52-3]|nr:MAG: hypothetical protein AYK22_02555 [Thermoplasmatales archaeon SG8-52-3]